MAATGGPLENHLDKSLAVRWCCHRWATGGPPEAYAIRDMVIKSGKGKIEEIKESVKEGIINRTDEYKYLGWRFSEANNIRRQLH